MNKVQEKWFNYAYALIRKARDEETDKAKKDNLTNALAGLILVRDEGDK